jgi:hypothetical protein
MAGRPESLWIQAATAGAAAGVLAEVMVFRLNLEVPQHRPGDVLVERRLATWAPSASGRSCSRSAPPCAPCADGKSGWRRSSPRSPTGGRHA